MAALPAPQASAIQLWADATTNQESARRHDLVRDKQNAVGSFFGFVGKHPAEVKPGDVKAWRIELEERGLSAASIYGRVSRVSSFYNWALKDPELAESIKRNPVRFARPKAPKAYQNESTKALTDEEVQRLVDVVKEKADVGSTTAKRDYALLLLYLLTGMRRSEIMRLRWGDIEHNGTVVIETTVKGGDYESREIKNPAARDALIEYLEASGRLNSMKADSPLWTRHDRAGKTGQADDLARLRGEFEEVRQGVGIDHIHLHQPRHTYARMVSEDTGSIIETQDALGHSNAATTRVYVQRIAVKRDKHSDAIARRLGV